MIIKSSGEFYYPEELERPSRTHAAASLLAVDYGWHVTPEVAWSNSHYFFPHEPPVAFAILLERGIHPPSRANRAEDKCEARAI